MSESCLRDRGHRLSSGPTRGRAGITGGGGLGETPKSNGAVAPSSHALGGGLPAVKVNGGFTAEIVPQRSNGGIAAEARENDGIAAVAGREDHGDLSVEEPVAREPLTALRPMSPNSCTLSANGGSCSAEQQAAGAAAAGAGAMARATEEEASQGRVKRMEEGARVRSGSSHQRSC